MAEISKYSWDKVKKEKLSETFYRQMVYGEKVMVAQLDIRKGSVVPEHMHENEQITWIMKGKLHFKIDGKEMDVGQGEIVIIPPNIKHEAIALEDTLDVDVFSPVRSDWINGTDSYLRK
ncbi:MAG: cupin domain-containing protein [Candidatus Thermoplasmatota archaeon]|jgi:quercetin dioxygenase-like cupin family protein|uniref:cupin domain-containing protein n=1 Tax=Ferroplasma sp. TaxID=2591003 RepID=UPI0017A7BF03|nr:cupin domain-containing protein [Ferroplasma sp.]MCL4311810.1 cupin domain-containing protein [Candidatus Thermoplasmatota archaeon]HII81753.1 cupin domain-containing protein [Ferroplasma sp.]